jgi:hypothetical protein
LSRRAVLAVAEAVTLWNVTIIFGHPEDAVSVAFVIYALIFAMDERFVGAGWLFGVGLAFQPLALVALPILVAMAGRKRALWLAVRGAVPAAVLTAPPLVAAFRDTLHATVTQPTFPDLSVSHQTPWTFLAPRLGGTGKATKVGGGPPRVAVLVAAVALGWWARRWRERPEMLAWGLALALSLRIFLETVMYSYYIWPAVAVAMAVAARGSLRRFALAVTLGIGATIVGQWHMGWLPWWSIAVACIAGLLVAASRPDPIQPENRRGTQAGSRRNGAAAPKQPLPAKTAKTAKTARSPMPSSTPRRQVSGEAKNKTRERSAAARQGKAGQGKAGQDAAKKGSNASRNSRRSAPRSSPSR